MDDLDHYFIKNYDRAAARLSGHKDEDRHQVYASLRANSIENPDPAKINSHTVCSSTGTVQNVLYSYYLIGEVRNKISHADAKAMEDLRLRTADSSTSLAMVIMQESIE